MFGYLQKKAYLCRQKLKNHDKTRTFFLGSTHANRWIDGIYAGYVCVKIQV